MECKINVNLLLCISWFCLMEVVSFIFLKCEQSRYYLELYAIYNNYIWLLLPMQINSARKLCENLGVNFLHWKLFTNEFMEMYNNIHKCNIKLPIVTLNFSPISFRVPQLPAAVTCFPMVLTLNHLMCYYTIHTFISTLVTKFFGKEFIPRFDRSLVKFPDYVKILFS